MSDPLDLLGGLDDLDATLFGKKSEPRAKPPTLSNLDSIFGDSKPAAKRPTVTFAEPSKPSTPGPVASKGQFDSLFGDTPTPSTSTPTPAHSNPRSRPRTSSSDALGVPAHADPSPAVIQSAPVDTGQQSRIQRLENEVERLNREIDDLNRRKKREVEEVEAEWRDRLLNKEKQWKAEREDIEANYQKQLQKSDEQHEIDLQRMRDSFTKQVDALQSTSSQSRDVVSVVDKVDLLSSQISDLVHSVEISSSKFANETELTLKVREAQLQAREQAFKTDLERLQVERENVTLLNLKLKDLIQEQEDSIQKDKWKIREEQNRLNAERRVFKEDQKYVLESMEKQRRAVESARSAFLKEQHDLLVRVSVEKESLEREQQEFMFKRSADVRRIKEEATLLQQRIQNVQLAEEHAENLRQHYEAKYKQLCDLEASLMEECMELEQLRNQGGISVPPRAPAFLANRNNKATPKTTPKFEDEEVQQNDNRSESVRAVLKQHADFLEKYTGQRVAAVAPQHSADEWRT